MSQKPGSTHLRLMAIGTRIVKALEVVRVPLQARVDRWLAATSYPETGVIAPVRITTNVMADGSVVVYDIQPLAHKKTLPAKGPSLSDSVASGVQRFFKVRDLLENVKEDGAGAYQADFATGQPTQAMTSEAERERLLEAVRASAPARGC